MAKVNLKSTLWFLSRPKTYIDYLFKVCLAINKRISTPAGSEAWCKQKALSIKDLILKITGDHKEFNLPESQSVNGILLYNLAEYLEATRIIETGVCEGRSSRALLESLKNRNGRLVSTDIPLPEKWVEPGCFVPEELKQFWEIVRLPDRIGLPKVLEKMPETDMCYYDSDKSYRGRMFGYSLLWNCLREGGILVSDDIDDNYGFRDFCEKRGIECFVAENNGGRFVGVIVKEQSNKT